jgi:hypothetical protein
MPFSTPAGVQFWQSLPITRQFEKEVAYYYQGLKNVLSAVKCHKATGLNAQPSGLGY